MKTVLGFTVFIVLVRTDDLYARFAPGITSWQLIPGAGHNTVSNDPLYVQALQNALKRSGGLAQSGQQ
jgi:hypothetical protein